MIIVMRMGAEAHEVGGVIQRIQGLGYRPHVSSGSERVIVGVIGNDRPLDPEDFLSLSGVEKVIPILQPYKLASRDFKPADTVIRVNDALIGGENVTFMAGPCSVESREQTFEVARQLRDMGVKIMRGVHSNLARRPTASRAWARKDCRSSLMCARSLACPSSPK